jgi:hypothetical protein
VSNQKRREEDKKEEEKGKFEAFLQSLKGGEDDFLVESIEKGYRACFEVGGVFFSSTGSPMGKSYSPYLKRRPTKLNTHEYRTNLPFSIKGEPDLEVKITFEWEPAERQTRMQPGTEESANPISVVILDSKYNRTGGNPEVLEPYYGKDIINLLSKEHKDKLEEDFLTDEHVYIPSRDFVPEPEDMPNVDR